MGVNKNIDELKKELADMHKLFDHALSDKKKTLDVKKTDKTPLIKDNKEQLKENSLSKKTISKQESPINKPILSNEKEANFNDDIENKKKLTEETKIVEIKDETENFHKTLPTYKEISLGEENDNLDDITFSFDDNSDIEDNSKIIKLNKNEQYLSIREKLERIKNEIKQKELELKNKK